LQTFPNIHPDAFVHDHDRAALEALRKVPGLSPFMKAITKGTLERQVHLAKHATNVKLGPAQYPSLYRMVTDAAEVLDVPVPDVYLDTGYTVNAWAFGFTRYTVTLFSGTIDLLTDDQLRAVIGHEIGHIACEHMLYKSAADLIRFLGEMALVRYLGPVASLAMAPIKMALLQWSRAAEFSCDRAALLVVQDPELVAHTLASLAGRSSRWAHEFQLDQVLAQAETIQEPESSIGGVLDAIRQLNQTHPDPVRRASEIMKWSETPAYHEILAGRYPRRDGRHGMPQLDQSDLDAPTADPPAAPEPPPSPPPAPAPADPCPACQTERTGAVRCPSCDLRRNPHFHLACRACSALNDMKWTTCRGCDQALWV
jgi:Zn-dependent protease with chaperone function